MQIWESITAIGTATIAIATALTLWSEIKRSRLSQAVDIVLQLDAKFNSDEWRERRSRAAREISSGKLDSEAENIIDLFETLAFLTENRKVVDEEAIWHFFSYWINNYYELMRSRIDERRRNDPTVWQDIVPFVEKLRSIDARRRGLPHVAQTIPTSNELAQFLEEERSEGTPISRSMSSR
jgi:hypothetical protein